MKRQAIVSAAHGARVFQGEGPPVKPELQEALEAAGGMRGDPAWPALETSLRALLPLDKASRERVVHCIAAFFGIDH